MRVPSSDLVLEDPPPDLPLSTMASLTANDLLRYASALEGQRLTTAGGRAAFTVRVLPRGIEVTPESSGNPRIVPRAAIQLVIEEYEQSRNLQPGQYQSITFDASYLLGIIAHYLREEAGLDRSEPGSGRRNAAAGR